jgi:DNA-binding response OmpR family regulator
MRVLVADDDRDAALMLAVLLEDDGHQVQAVYQGTDVISAVRAFEPHAVLLDIKMPGMSGFEVARAIRSRYGDTKPLLVAISGHYKQGSDRILGEIAGFDHYFAKPCDPNALLSLLKL